MRRGVRRSRSLSPCLQANVPEAQSPDAGRALELRQPGEGFLPRERIEVPSRVLQQGSIFGHVAAAPVVYSLRGAEEGRTL